MKKLIIILSALVVLVLSSCNFTGKAESYNEINNTKELTNTEKNEELINNTENTETDAFDKDITIKSDNFCFDYDTIVMDDEFYEKNPEFGEAILKITPVEYSFFTYITESGERDNEIKCAELSATVEEIVTSRGSFDLKAGQNITINQFLSVYPSSEYWNDFAETYGGGSIKNIPAGLYKHDNAKLDELGIITLSTFNDTPFLKCGESYYACVSSVKNETGTEYYSSLYCDVNYNPIVAGASGEKNYTTLAGMFSGKAEEFAEKVKELKK